MQGVIFTTLVYYHKSLSSASDFCTVEIILRRHKSVARNDFTNKKTKITLDFFDSLIYNTFR